MKKAVFFDIDGTLMDHHNFIPKSTVDGIHRLQEKGNYAFLCTGRSRAFVRHPAIMEIGFDGIVSGCGTMIEFHDKVVYYKKLEPDVVKQTVDFLKAHHVAVIMEGRYKLYADAQDFRGDQYIARVREELGSDLVPITGCEDAWEVSKFSCVTESADMDTLKRHLEKDYELIIHDIAVMEVVPKGCTKGTGILKVCEMLDIPVSDSYAFGDSANDLPMFEAAGCSIAMGNATDLAKQRASYVTDALHEDGIFHALEHFGLC